MIASERRKRILESLNAKGIISLKETARELGISEITARRDFEKLENEGKLKRVQGGATLEGAEDGAELTMNKKMLLNIREKEVVAKYGAGLVEDGSCIFVDGGTSMLPLFQLLSRRSVMIVTYNTIALKKIVNPVAEMVIIGGKYQAHYDMNVGPLAQDMLRHFSFDAAFLGCSGVSLAQRAAYTAEMESHAMKRIAMEVSLKNYLLMDSSKFSKRGFFKLADFSEFEAVITDSFETDEILPENFILV